MGCGATCSDNVMKATLLVASVPCGCLTLWTLISMTCRKNPKRKVQKRDVVQLIVHLSAALWTVAFWEKFNRKWDEDRDPFLCTTITVLIHSGQLVQKFAMLLVWYMRFRTLIGPIYPYWVQYPTLLMTLGIPVWFVYDGLTVSGGFKEIGARGTVCYYTGSLDNFVLISGILLVVPALILLILFVVPLSYYTYMETSFFVRFIFKHMAVTILDIVIQVSFMVSYETFDKNADRSGFHHLLSARNIGVLVSNLLIVYVFADWQERLLYGFDECGERITYVIRRASRWSSKIDRPDVVVTVSERWQHSLFVDDVLAKRNTSVRFSKVDFVMSELEIKTTYESDFPNDDRVDLSSIMED